MGCWIVLWIFTRKHYSYKTWLNKSFTNKHSTMGSLINLLRMQENCLLTPSKRYYLYSKLSSLWNMKSSTWYEIFSIQHAEHMSHMNSVKWPCSLWVLVAQWIERPPGVRKVMGSIPSGDSDFSLSHAHVMLNISYLTFNYWAQNSPSSFTYHYLHCFDFIWHGVILVRVILKAQHNSTCCKLLSRPY